MGFLKKPEKTKTKKHLNIFEEEKEPTRFLKNVLKITLNVGTFKKIAVLVFNLILSGYYLIF